MVVIKHHEQSKLEKKGFTSLTLLKSQFIIQGKSEQEVRAGVWRQAQKQGLWRNSAYRLAPQGLLSILSYTTQDYLSRGDTTHGN